MTQDEQVLDYIQKNGSITTLDAIYDLGITRLSAKIFNLKKEGYPIANKVEESRNRNGKIVRYKRYYLES